MNSYKKYRKWNEYDAFYRTRKVATLRVVEKYRIPKQFMVMSGSFSDPEEYTLYENKEDPHSNLNNNVLEVYERKITKEPDDTDLDFMMPSRVREVLRLEGLPSDVIDKSVRNGERKYRHAQHLTFRQAKSFKRSNDSNRYSQQKSLTLPRIQTSASPRPDTTCHPPGCDCCHDVTIRREKRHTRSKPWCSRSVTPSLPEMIHSEQPVLQSESIIEEDIQFNLTDAERIKWFSEQQFEKAMVGSNFDPPRLLLISSKIPKTYVIPKVLLEGNNVVHIVYDFEVGTFTDILESISEKLEKIKTGCKAKSIMLYCQGGPGYLYILRKFAVTPQKLKKESYKCVREFWKSLSGFVSKIDPSESAIHICGCPLAQNTQGREVVRFIQRIAQHNMVRIKAHDDQTAKGQKIIELYFNKRRFYFWKSRQNDSDDEIDFLSLEPDSPIEVNECNNEDDDEENDTDDGGEVRTWSSLAAQIADDE